VPPREGKGGREALVADILKSGYGIEPEGPIRPLGGRAFLLSGKGGLVLKFHNRETAPDPADLERILRSCSSENLTPAHVFNLEGRVVTEHAGHLTSLQEWRPSGNEELPRAETTAGALRALHQTLRGCGLNHIQNHLDRALGDARNLAIRYGYEDRVGLLEHVTNWINAKGQLIHGDLHAGNFGCASGRVWFLDFDSATRGSPEQDIAFACFRIYADPQARRDFIREYFGNEPSGGVSDVGDLDGHVERVRMHLEYAVLQRILFILLKREQGDESHMWDLENQKGYLELAAAFPDTG
jgi:Ser/Thr protein kinase RdoA (MazF antagonist)